MPEVDVSEVECMGSINRLKEWVLAGAAVMAVEPDVLDLEEDALGFGEAMTAPEADVNCCWVFLLVVVRLLFLETDCWKTCCC